MATITSNRARRTIALLLLGSLAISGCLTPPALMPPRAVDREHALSAYPAGSERVDLEVEPGVHLRGVFVPSQPHAPVVLHLLESSGSVASAKLHFGPVTRQLSDLGYASLLVDYTGVGWSDGSRSVDNLERDALAMWREAQRRAGGAPVWIRATSIGTIPMAQLLAYGERPAKIVLIAPVLASSAVPRFASALHGPLAGVVAAAAFRDVAHVDAIAELKKAKVSVLAITSAQDVLLTEGDRMRLGAALHPAGRLLLRDGGHLQVALDAHALLREELRFFEPCCSAEVARARAQTILAALGETDRARFADGSVERARLDALCARCAHGDPRAIAAASLAIQRPEIAVRMLWLSARGKHAELTFDEWRTALSLDDPAGMLPIDLIEDVARPSEQVLDYGGSLRELDADDFARAAQPRGMLACNIDWGTTMTVARDQAVRVSLDGDRFFQALLDRGVPPLDAERQFVRILLKGHRIPDRLHTGADGRVAVEVKENGDWRVLAPDLNPDRPMAFHVRVVK